MIDNRALKSMLNNINIDFDINYDCMRVLSSSYTYILKLRFNLFDTTNVIKEHTNFELINNLTGIFKNTLLRKHKLKILVFINNTLNIQFSVYDANISQLLDGIEFIYTFEIQIYDANVLESNKIAVATITVLNCCINHNQHLKVPIII